MTDVVAPDVDRRRAEPDDWYDEPPDRGADSTAENTVDHGGGASGERRGPPGRIDLRSLVGHLQAPTGQVLLVVAIVGLLVASVTAATQHAREPVHEGSQVLLIDQPGALVQAPSGDLVAKLATLRVKYVSLLQADAVIDPAAEELGMEPGEVAGAVHAAAPPESLLIRISARAGEPEQAERISGEVAASLSRYLAAEQDQFELDEALRITLTPLREPTYDGQVSPSARRSASVGLVGGLVAAGLLYLALSLHATLRRPG